MIMVRLDQAEIEYLRELVNEAWFYKRKTNFSERKQEALSQALTKALEGMKQ